MNKPPAILYQYCSEHAVDILLKKRIKTSTPSSLNDPFEWMPSVDEEVAADEIWKTLNKLDRKMPFPSKPTRSAVAAMKSKAITVARSYQSHFRTDLEKLTRLICLSSRNDGILMWSHYADRHQGFVVGYNTAYLGRYASESVFLKVNYGDQRPVIPHPYLSPSNEEQLLLAVSHKSREWAYEDEWRLLVDTKHLQKDLVYKTEDVFLPISSAVIGQIIFGTRSSGALIERINILLANSALKHVKTFQARLDPKYFKILVEPI